MCMCVFYGGMTLDGGLSRKHHHPSAVSAQSHSKDKKGQPHSFHDHKTAVSCNESNWLIAVS